MTNKNTPIKNSNSILKKLFNSKTIIRSQTNQPHQPKSINYRISTDQANTETHTDLYNASIAMRTIEYLLITVPVPGIIPLFGIRRSCIISRAPGPEPGFFRNHPPTFRRLLNLVLAPVWNGKKAWTLAAITATVSEIWMRFRCGIKRWLSSLFRWWCLDFVRVLFMCFFLWFLCGGWWFFS